ncbi:hypothetical protein RJ641_007550 [Dillenia turbinata]|uniref:Uncharacterized protein n=1 Tax=Dillenia turbinata TaxID=194707 RepID=A0AAN8Z5P8_9MAGN
MTYLRSTFNLFMKKELRDKQVAKSSEFLLSRELERRKEMEEVLAAEKQDLKKIKLQNDNFMKEIQIVRSQKSELENQLLNTKCTVDELEEKIVSAVELLITFKGQRDKLKTEHENAVREAMRIKALAGGDTRSLCEAELFAFTFMEINEAQNI